MKVRLWQEPNLLDPDGDLDALRRLLDAGIPSRHDWIEIYDEPYHTWKLVTYVFYCRILLTQRPDGKASRDPPYPSRRPHHDGGSARSQSGPAPQSGVR
jgi:hypothetical protein